jgi:crossover junction endodeoxyribonuclease RuvC
MRSLSFRVGKLPEEKIILGLDPGTNVMGYGLIEIAKSKITLLQYGVIHLSKYEGYELKLKKIFERILSLVDEYHPDEVALEAPFYGKNVQSMLKLGRAQGVAMAAALYRDIPITEYAPKKVKQSVTGNGNASKEQVAKMLMMMLSIKEMPKLLDATDALAVALCHHLQNKIDIPTEKKSTTRKSSSKKSSSWETFLKENPDRKKS